MGEIRKDNLHESLIEELNELANIDLSGYQEKTDENLMTESKDLVGAINELFQNANNGKQLIATAIGEPLNVEDTFSAMSDDINSLLATFKTNMMNNGVTVNSGDKFKSLIDKIATMVEEGQGKGIQYAEGVMDNINALNVNTSTQSISLNHDCDFIPTVMCLSFDRIDCYGDSCYMTNVNITNYNTDINNPCVVNFYATNKNVVNLLMSVDNISNNSVRFNYSTYSSLASLQINITGIKWYAIGVGEEDTTLRDSLASILEEEGVNITEEDDMASLIGKVDSEFTKDNNTISELETELAGKVTPAGTAVASDVASGKTFINSTGKVITGTASAITQGRVNYTEVQTFADFTMKDGKTVSKCYVELQFTFDPTIIYVYNESYGYFSVYTSDNIRCCIGVLGSNNTNSTLIPYNANSVVKLGNNKFRIPVHVGGTNYLYYAF